MAYALFYALLCDHPCEACRDDMLSLYCHAIYELLTSGHTVNEAHDWSAGPDGAVLITRLLERYPIVLEWGVGRRRGRHPLAVHSPRCLRGRGRFRTTIRICPCIAFVMVLRSGDDCGMYLLYVFRSWEIAMYP